MIPFNNAESSNLGVVSATRGYVPVVYLYRRPYGTSDDVGRLKAALTKALVSFYPLAGRLAVDGNGRPEVDCNMEGAVFVVERAGLAVDGARQFELSPEMRRLFIPPRRFMGARHRRARRPGAYVR